MNRYRLSALLIAVAAACALLCGCGDNGSQKPVRDAVSVWYIEGDPLSDTLQEQAQEYNDNVEDELLTVAFRAFENEEQLSAAFEDARCDLLLCSHSKALDLYDRGLLRDVGAALSQGAPDYPSYLSERFSGVGRGFFPLGSSVQLLYFAEDKTGLSSLSDPEELFTAACQYGREQGLPFFTADSYADLFYELLLSLDSEFHANRSTDLRDVNYTYVYNLMADAAYEGGLVSLSYDGAELVQSGYLPCAAVASQSLAGAKLDGYDIAPLPRFRDSRVCLADTEGLAVTAREGRSIKSIAAFLSWVFEDGRLGALALDSALVPAAAPADIAVDDALEKTLMDIYLNYELHLPDYGCDYLQNRAGFETNFRAAVEFFG